MRWIIYGLRISLAFPLLYLGFALDNLAGWMWRNSETVASISVRLQDLAVDIEGETPDAYEFTR